jgi:glycerol-3-phosphate dehydrogenase
VSDPIGQFWPTSYLGPEQRASAWERLGSEQFDVVVIGGGVVG